MGQAGFDNTIIIVCSDNGWQMPRGLASLYDYGTHVPLVVYAPKFFKGGRVVADFVSLNDFAPTFLELAGIPIPKEMNAKSLVNILKSDKEGIVEPERDYIVTARERHAYVRKDGVGYPSRAIRTNEYLFIRNYEPDRWPAGDPPLYGDVDAFNLAFPCPTKLFMLKNCETEGVKDLFTLGFGKRPAEELYDLAKDPDQIHNVAGLPEYDKVMNRLSEKLTNHLKKYGDPRETDGEIIWDKAPYYAEKDFVVRPSEEARKLLNLEEEYSYIDSE
jgi:arylsulfatase A-like enzyme